MTVEGEQSMRSDGRCGDSFTGAAREREHDRPDSTLPSYEDVSYYEEDVLAKSLLLAGDEAVESTAQKIGRSAFFDDAAMTATLDNDVTQIVHMAAEKYAHAVRLPLPLGQVSLYELELATDEPVGCEKNKPIIPLDAMLSPAEHSLSHCRVIPVDVGNPEHGADPSRNWAEMLVNAGFDSKLPSVWMMEGLTYYLPPVGWCTFYCVFATNSSVEQSVEIEFDPVASKHCLNL